MKNGVWTLTMVGLAAAAALFVVDGVVDLDTAPQAHAPTDTVPLESRAHLKFVIGAGLGLGALFAARRLIR
jgi:hypothetical protein